MPVLPVEGGLLLALIRGLWVAALLGSVGTLVFWSLVVPRTVARAPAETCHRVDRSLAWLSWVGLAACVLLLLAWGLAESADIADAVGLRATLAAVGPVLSGTTFGHLLLLQLAGLVATALVLWSGRRWVATGLIMLTGALQAGHGHALAMVDGPSLLLLAGVVHVLAAGAWLGGLLPLLLVVRVAPARTGAAAARWFSPLGKWCIALLVGSAAVQFWQLIGGLPGLVGTAYGWVATAKLALLAALLGFAAVNRYRFAPRLLGTDPAAAGATLLRSVAVQTGVGLLVVLAASLLSSLPPAVHEQPVWPFASRPSLVVMTDPDLAQEVVHAMVGVLGGLAAVLVGAALYRRRVLALTGILVGLGVGGAAASHLDLLFVEAYPTSYFHSPSGFAASSITAGAALFQQHCAACHGTDGRGDGPAAATLAVSPADLTAGHLWAHDDGELFWWLTHGIDAPEGGLAMPGFAAQLSADDRWALIDDIRAHNAGVGFREASGWPVPVQAPGFAMSCPGGRSVTMAELRGSAVHIVTTPNAAEPPPTGGAIPTVTVLVAQDAQVPTDACVSTDPAVWQAYAVLLGVSGSALAGAEFIVDQNGWLRAAQRPDERVMRWADPKLLLADVQAICRSPIAAPAGGHVHH